jgi:hypothetical protein
MNDILLLSHIIMHILFYPKLFYHKLLVVILSHIILGYSRLFFKNMSLTINHTIESLFKWMIFFCCHILLYTFFFILSYFTINYWWLFCHTLFLVILSYITICYWWLLYCKLLLILFGGLLLVILNYFTIFIFGYSIVSYCWIY